MYFYADTGKTTITKRIMKKFAIALLLPALLLTGCTSTGQLQGAFMGGTLGGIFGSAIGGMADGPRGRDAGAAMGVLIGATVGAATVANAEAAAAEGTATTTDVDVYNRRSTTVAVPMTRVVPSEIACLEIEELRFIDANNNHFLEREEMAEIVFEIRNTGPVTVYNVAPIVRSLDPKHIEISNPAIIGHIEPGQAVRYTAKVRPDKRIKDGEVGFRVGFAHGEEVYDKREFNLQTMGPKGPKR